MNSDYLTKGNRYGYNIIKRYSKYKDKKKISNFVNE